MLCFFIIKETVVILIIININSTNINIVTAGGGNDVILKYKNRYFTQVIQIKVLD